MRSLAVFAACLALTTLAYGQTAVEATPLSAEEFRKELTEYKLDLSAEEREGARIALPELKGDDQARVDALRAALESSDPVNLRLLVELPYGVKNRALHSRLFANPDPLLHFVCCLTLTSAGDAAAAKSLFDLLHSERPTPRQRQMLKSYAVGLGLRPATDTAESILDYLTTAFSETPKLKPGDAAPDFTVKDIAGKTWRLSALKNKIVLLHFWSTSCGPCMANMPSFGQQIGQYPADRVLVFSVSLDDDRQPYDQAIKKFDYRWVNIFDGAGWGGPLARAFGVNHMPFDVVIDQRGVVKSNDMQDVSRLLSPAGE